MRKILFDLYGLFMKTQTPDDQRRIEQAARTEELGVSADDFWRAYRELRDPLDAGTMSFGDYIDSMSEELSVSFTDAERIFESDYNSWSNHDPDMVAWLEELIESGVQPALLSNIPTGLVEKLNETQPWLRLFDPLIFSCDTGFAKPDPRIYEEAMRQMNAEPHDVLFLDDTQINIDAAHDFGLNAVRFTDIEQARKDVEAFLAGENIGASHDS